MNSSQNKYPTKKIVLCYLLFGGSIGCILLTPSILYMELRERGFMLAEINVHHIVEQPSWLLVSGATGFFWGFLPSLFTAIFIVRTKMLLINYKSYVSLFIVSCVSSSLTSSIVGMIMQSLFLFLTLTVISGLSAIIVGYFVIPKEIKHE